MSPPLHVVARAIEVALRAVHAAYPARFRARFGRELQAAVRRDIEEAAAGGVPELARRGAQTVVDALRGVIPEHRAERARARQMSGHHRTGAAMPGRGVGVDLRDAVRSLRNSATFTLVALGVLALAIGAATSIFSVVDGVLLRGLPFDEADRLVAVQEYVEASPRSPGTVTPQSFLDWRSQQRSFEALGAASRVLFRLKNERDEPVDARGLRITYEFLRALRVVPMIGRGFTEADEVDGAGRVVILGYGFWQRQYGGSPDVVGRTIALDGQPWEIVGVMPAGFSYPVASERPTEVFTPVVFRGADRVRARTRNFVLSVVGRLGPGVSVATADAEMRAIAEGIDRAHPDWNPGSRARVVDLHEHLVGRVRSWMLMLLGAVALVVVIACANVANLMLVRATVRAREMGVRSALGASRWRLTRALLVEGLVLSVLAAALGVLLAWGGVQVLRAWLPDGLPRVASIAVDLRVLGAAAAAAVVTGVGFGLVPALQATRTDLTYALKDGGRTSAGGARGTRLRSLFVVAEVALAVVLLVGAGLFVSSFVRLIRIDPGLDPRNVLALGVSLPFNAASYRENVKLGGTYVQRMLEAVSQVPGVEQVGAVTGGLPLSGSRRYDDVALPGAPPLQGTDAEIDTTAVSQHYFEVLRVPLRRGRVPGPEAREGTPPVVVVNDTASRLYWPGRDALGQRIVIGSTEREVVGVVGDIRHDGPETPPRQAAFVPLGQERTLGGTLVIRTAGDPLAVLPAVKAAIWSVNPEQRLTADTFTLEGYMDRLLAQRRFNMALLAIFGVVGLVIAAAGIYGVMAYAVAQRTSEIGVRMALGATPRDVIALVLRNAGALLAAGLAIGAAAAFQLGASVEKFLFEVKPADPGVFVGALAILALAGLVASAVPARRAAAVDPVVALRSE
jgi:predicted permease